jgi:hypothetical protein
MKESTMSQHPVAICNLTKSAQKKAKSPHVLARVRVESGKPVLEYSLAVPGLAIRDNGKPRGEYNFKALWQTVEFDSEDAQTASALAYCESCRKEYFIDFAQLIAGFRAGNGPIVLSFLK